MQPEFCGESLSYIFLAASGNCKRPCYILLLQVSTAQLCYRKKIPILLSVLIMVVITVSYYLNASSFICGMNRLIESLLASREALRLANSRFFLSLVASDMILDTSRSRIDEESTVHYCHIPKSSVFCLMYLGCWFGRQVERRKVHGRNAETRLKHD